MQRWCRLQARQLAGASAKGSPRTWEGPMNKHWAADRAAAHSWGACPSWSALSLAERIVLGSYRLLRASTPRARGCRVLAALGR
jgi:hypothetical protein